ncbi:hypothetical protein, partial [Lelliottia nimipressuralis]
AIRKDGLFAFLSLYKINPGPAQQPGYRPSIQSRITLLNRIKPLLCKESASYSAAISVKK